MALSRAKLGYETQAVATKPLTSVNVFWTKQVGPAAVPHHGDNPLINPAGTAVGKVSTVITGDAVATEFTITHNLNEQWPTAQVWDVATGASALVDITSLGVNSLKLTFITAPALGAEYRVIVIG